MIDPHAGRLPNEQLGQVISKTDVSMPDRIGNLGRGIGSDHVGVSHRSLRRSRNGLVFVHQNTLTSAVREGIRIGTVGATSVDGNGNALSRENSIKQAIQHSASAVMDIDPSNIFIFPIDADWTDPDDPAVVGTARAGGAGAFMRVRVNFTHQFFTQLICGLFGPGDTIVISSEGTYRNENFILGGGS